MGDGEQTEGQIWEAAIAGAHWGLDNLVGIVDINAAGSDGDPQETMKTEPLKAKWEAFGWRTLVLSDGHDLDAVSAALNAALNEPDGRPTCILAYTVSGKGVTLHGRRLGMAPGLPRPEGPAARLPRKCWKEASDE